MKDNKGLTLVELLVTLFILGIVLAAAYFTYIHLLKGFKQESEEVSTQIESLVGLEILRLDLEHIGYGIASNETSPIVQWDENNKTLVLRSTLNNTNTSTRGYLILQCQDGSYTVKLDSREDKTNNNVSILKISDKSFVASGDFTGMSCSGNDLYIALPISNTSNSCSVGYCTQITYKLSSSNLIDRCNVNTYNLIRKVGTGNTGGEPVLNCVSDWTVKFDVDTDGNSKIDATEENQDTLPAANSDIRTKLKRINVYLLVQEGRYDPDFTFTNTVSCASGGGKCVSKYSIELKLPAGYEHYRWKFLKISVKPMDL
jgi:type IV pilus assembly protein PilW